MRLYLFIIILADIYLSVFGAIPDTIADAITTPTIQFITTTVNGARTSSPENTQTISTTNEALTTNSPEKNKAEAITIKINNALTTNSPEKSTKTITTTTTDDATTTNAPEKEHQTESSSFSRPKSCKNYQKMNPTLSREKGLEKGIFLGHAVLIILAVGILSAIIASSFYWVRKHVYHDSKGLDTAFDAGGKVSIGLTASTIVSHWTWGATLLQSCTVAAKYGLSGPYWYAAGATIQIIVFAILSIQLKTKAPGAKTFLQVIYVRFGKAAHLVFCFFALLTNAIIQMNLMISGIAVIVGLVQEFTTDLAAMLLGIIIGSYTLIGGLGATFYVSYFNTALIYTLICWLVVEVFYNPFNNPKNPFGSSDAVYNLVSCWEGPTTNYEKSYLTFYSVGGAVFGVVNIVGNFGAVFCDQAYWQKSVAAKPLHGVWGFVLGAITWFAVPFALATTMGMAYLGLSSANGQAMLSDEDIQAGLVAPYVAQNILGKNGEFIMLTLLLLVVMAAGSSEVIAVAAIVVYDIYQIYIKPFRTGLKDNQCILCLKFIHKHHNYQTLPDELVCRCTSMTKCSDCKADNTIRTAVKGLVKPHFSCPVHKEYREYMEKLLYYKNWWIVNATILSIILPLLAAYAHLDLGWLYLLIGVLISSAVVPIAFSIMWTRATAAGMIAGSLSGLILALISWLVYSSTLPGGLSNFLENTGNDYSMLVGNVVAIVGGGLVATVVSVASKPHWSAEELAGEWEKTRNIDNPLRPWVEGYESELNLEAGTQVIHDRPSLEVVVRKFRAAWWTAVITAVFLVLLLLLVWPLAMFLAVDILSRAGFLVWTTITRGWAYLATAFIILVPLAQEIYSIAMQMRHNSKTRHENTSSQHQPSVADLNGTLYKTPGKNSQETTDHTLVHYNSID